MVEGFLRNARSEKRNLLNGQTGKRGERPEGQQTEVVAAAANEPGDFPGRTTNW